MQKRRNLINSLKLSYRLSGILNGRYLRYSLGYFWQTMRYFRLVFPGVILYRPFFKLLEGKRLHRNSHEPILSASYQNMTEMDFLIKAIQPQRKNVALALPKMATRYGFAMEGEMLFAYKNSLLSMGIEPLIVNPDLNSTNSNSRNDLFALLIDHRTEVLIFQGDTMLKGSQFLDEKFIRQVRDSGIAIVVDLVDCFITRGGQYVVDFYLDKADFLICHNSRLQLHGNFVNNSLVWPSLPYPEKFYFDRHVEKPEGLLIPGSNHRDRKYFARYAKKYKLDSRQRMFSNSDNSSARYSYSDYVDSLCKAMLIFTNGYKSRHESQIIGRVTETMLANSTLLYESGSDINYFFEPFKDYIPVHNLPDFVEKARYLLNNPHEARRFAANGLDTMLKKYSTEVFWDRIFSCLK